MSQSRRICRLGAVVATGIIALIGIVPSGAVATGHSDTTQQSQGVPMGKTGDGWCC